MEKIIEKCILQIGITCAACYDAGFAGDKVLIKMHEKKQSNWHSRGKLLLFKTCFAARTWIQIMWHKATSSQQAVCKIETRSSKKQQIYHNFSDFLNLWRWLSFTSMLIASTFMAESSCKFVQLLNENWLIGFCCSHVHWKRGEIFPILGDVIIAKWKKTCRQSTQWHWVCVF